MESHDHQVMKAHNMLVFFKLPSFKSWKRKWRKKFHQYSPLFHVGKMEWKKKLYILAEFMWTLKLSVSSFLCYSITLCLYHSLPYLFHRCCQQNFSIFPSFLSFLLRTFHCLHARTHAHSVINKCTDFQRVLFSRV